jgi:small-conductance mechanosensitive channel
VVVEIAERFVIPYIYLLINYNIIRALQLTPFVERILTAALLFITMYFIVRLVNFFIQRSVVGYLEQSGEPIQRIKQVTGMLLLVKLFIWGIGLVMLVDNLGYDITAVIAGLGVGGIAIALAAQNILGDLFSYFVIFFDKPFEIGDFIIVGDNSGVVEKIGIKTSHVRSLDGQQLIMPNAEMVKSVIQNYKRLEKRRIVFSVGVVYATSSEKLKRIPGIIQDIIELDEYAIFDRTHLKAFGDFSINYEIVYYIESADYLLFMNTNQNICLQIFEQFEKEGIEFAFPTQTLFVKDENLVREGRRKESYA